MLSQIVVEIFFSLLVAIVTFHCVYWPVGYYSNAVLTGTQNVRAFQFIFGVVRRQHAPVGPELTSHAGPVLLVQFDLCASVHRRYVAHVLAST